MPKKHVTLVVGLLTALQLAAEQATKEVADALPPSPARALDGAPRWLGPESTVLYQNGPLSNSSGTGANGENESVLQNDSLNMTILGFGHQVVNNTRVADDFEVPAGETWDIGVITFFAYQTGSTFDSSITAVNVQIWDGVPEEIGSRVVCGDAVTNRLVSTSFTDVLRVTEVTTGIAADRPIMANRAGISCELTAGEYWVDWQTDGSLASGPWAPPIVVRGEDTTGNARQSIAGGPYERLEDSGSLTPQGLPFLITEAAPLAVDITGSCPGTMSVEVTGVTPGGPVAVAVGPSGGGFVIAGGACAGTELDLAGVFSFRNLTAGFDGRAAFDPVSADRICSDVVQAIDLATCALTPTTPVE